jgi:hypothetical protein
MEKYFIENDIKVICETAETFPNDVMKAHQALHSKLSSGDKRRFFGISRPEENYKIIYKAAAEVLPSDDINALGGETFVIKKGVYISEFIPNFMSNVSQINITFQELLKDPQIDPNGYCLEIYEGETDVRCLVGLIESR